MRALDSLAEGRTVLMITHRLSTVGKVDQIIVLKDGRIAEQGHYKELKKQGGIFANLLKIQNAFDINDDLSESFILTASQPPDRSTSEAELAMELDGQIISKRQLDKALLTIGRMVQNDIQVPLHNPAAQHVSRLHAKIVWKNNRWVIQDADSKYGLHYNGQKIDDHVLKDGDRIHIAPKIALIYGQKGQHPLSPIPISQKVPAIQSSLQHVQPQRAQVLIEAGGQLISKRELDKATLTIACKQENPNSDIQIPAQFMGQGIDAQIVWENGRWVAKAKHRVRYNGQMVPQHTLANGDRVYLAPTVALTYQLLPLF
jgi:pSer/pThr/pTyr-binding forkhead associated (FHA) protein